MTEPSSRVTVPLAACEEALAAFRAGLGERWRGAASVAYAEARLWELAGQPERALAVLRAALAGPDAQPWAAALNAVIRLAEASDSVAHSGAWLAELAQRPGLAAAGLWAGRLLEGADQAGAAAAYGACVAALGPAHPLAVQALQRQVAALVALWRPQEAIAVARDGAAGLGARAPGEAAALHVAAGGLLISLGRLAEAVAEAARAVDLAPEAAPGHFVRGAALWHLGHREAAREAFAAAVARDGTLAERVGEVTGGAADPGAAGGGGR